MKHIGFLLHFYQPPWQFEHILRQIAAECYYPLLEMILSHSGARFTANINFSLVELLKRHDLEKLLVLFGRAIKEGKIELTGSGAYHPILPLLEKDETNRQIILNKKGLEREGLRVGAGFFPPEMAFSPQIASALKFCGYNWTITEDIPFCAKYGYAPFEFIPETDSLPVILRSHFWSSMIAFRKIPGSIFESIDSGFGQWVNGGHGYLIVGMDAETFGHHHKGYIKDLREFLDDMAAKGPGRGYVLEKISEICASFPKKPLEVPSGSWSTSYEDAKNNIPFPLWDHPQNPVHHLLWKLTRTVVRHKDHMTSECRLILDRALNSCQFWWASLFHQNYGCAFQTIPLFWKIALEMNDKCLRDEVEGIISQLKAYTSHHISL